MFCCLFKKVTVHNTAKLNIISSNRTSNFIGIGGSEGFVKVVKIDITKPKTDQNSNNLLTFSQNLVCHKKKIVVLTWNENYEKLSTADEEGIIVVWKFTDRGTWEQEMINNRELSYVTDLKWDKQGFYLCFIYNDGHAIVGTVEGNRCWGNDIRDNLYLLEWSPDGSAILFASKNNNMVIFSSSGYQIGELEIDPILKNVMISKLSWWTNPYGESNNTLEKHLMVAFSNGIILLYDDYYDTKPFKIITEFNEIKGCEWNPSGDMIAVSGIIYGNNTEERRDVISFYSPLGNLLKTLKINSLITSFSWDSFGTKLAICTDSIILYALIKPKYKWTYFSNTLVYSFMTESDHHSMIFWDLNKNSRSLKYVKNLIDVTSHDSFCLLTAKVPDNNYILILCNSIGSPIDNRIINIYPEYICLTESHVFVSNKNYVYVWQFRNANSEINPNHYGMHINIELLKNKLMKEIIFYVEDIPNLNDTYNIESFDPSKTTSDLITSISANQNWLIITCESGRAFKYSLPFFGQPDKLALEKFYMSGISKDGMLLWGIDDNNMLSMWDIDKIAQGKKLKGIKLEFERKEVWSLIWSKDDNSKFAFMEKNRLNMMKEMENEELLTTNGYLAEYSDLEITVINLENLMNKPWDDKIQPNDIIIKIETRILRDLREMINNNISINDIYQFIDRNPHKKLWEILAEHAMLNLDYLYAEKAMLQYNDYLGLSFIKRVKIIDDDYLKRAESYQFFLKYDKAEEVYNMVDRKDLIIEMRMKLGHWDKVISLIKQSGYVQEDNLKLAYNNLASQAFDNKDYNKAEEYYNMTNNYEGLVNVWFKTEKFDKAIKFINIIPEGSEYLLFMGEKFEAYGLCDEAVNCYLRFGDVKRAIDTCVLNNKWNLAVELAEKNNFFQIEGLVNKFCNILIEKNKKMDLVELYRKAHKHTEAAKMLIKIGDDLKALKASPLVLKKIHVVAALEMESFKTRLMDAQISQITQNTYKTQTLDTLITSDLGNVSDKVLNNPWKGAEAYHFYMLCQTQIYQHKYHAATKTALRLVQYEKELDPKEVYRLIALSSFMNKSYKECSKALAKLENLTGLTKEEREKYQELAISIFTKFSPSNTKEQILKCPAKDCDADISEFDIDCKVCGSNFSACVLSGQSLYEKDYIKCKRCKHKSLKSEVTIRKNKYCGLCHIILDLK